MIAGKTALAVIPARGGSKGIPRKNLRTVGGRPLIAWAIEAARNSAVDRTILSTDDEEIARVAREWGGEVPCLRPPLLAGDAVSVVPAVRHAMETAGARYDYVVVLQPTSPLRRAADIDDGLRRIVAAGAATCVSVVEVRESPVWMFWLGAAGRLTPVLDTTLRPERRQEAPVAVVPDGTFYIAAWEWLLARDTLVDEHSIGCVIPRERSIDVDWESDLAVAEALLQFNRRGED